MTKKAIGLAEFEKLSLMEQLDIIHNSGVHVGKRELDGKRLILYQINDFYTEVHFAEYRKTVDKLLISKNVEIIQPYLRQIQVRDLDESNDGDF